MLKEICSDLEEPICEDDSIGTMTGIHEEQYENIFWVMTGEMPTQEAAEAFVRNYFISNGHVTGIDDISRVQEMEVYLDSQYEGLIQKIAVEFDNGNTRFSY